MYNKLLISAGGGIVSRSQQSEQDNVATIAIGLGGTGIDCLRLLKSEVYDKLKPDNGEDSVIPRYDHIKYLAVDTDKTSLGNINELNSIDENTEYFDISSQGIHDTMKTILNLNSKPEFYWLSRNLDVKSTENGAGGVRQAGRLLFIQKSKEFIEKIETMITSAKTGLQSGYSINVHIFTGISGGTGAGTFLDVCYLVNHVIESMGEYDHAEICGYFFLPDVNLSKVSNAKAREKIKITGFASMKELDYCMNFSTNHDKWSQEYAGFSYETSLPPVKLAHLITATKSNGELDPKAYEYAMHATVDFVFEFLTKPYVAQNNSTFSLNSHISNINGQMNNVIKEHGACYGYCLLGASMQYMPFKDILTYLSSKVFESFNYLPDKLPNESEMSKFLVDNNFTLDAISREVKKSVPMIPALEYYKELYDECMGLPDDGLPGTFTRMINTTGAGVTEVLETNVSALIKENKNISDDNANTTLTLIERVKAELKALSANSEYGPFFASHMLHSDKVRDLQSVLTGAIKGTKTQKEQENRNLSLALELQSKALKEFKRSNKIDRKSKGKAYISSIYNTCTVEREIKIQDSILNVLTKFKEQVEDLYSKYYSKFVSVFNELIQTFNANLSYLSQPVDLDEGYTKPIIKISDLKQNLDNTVKEMKLGQIFSYFVNELLNNDEDWLTGDENKICSLVCKFFLFNLNTSTNKTLMDYLEIKYDTKNNQELVDHILNDIINPVYNNSSPLFWVSSDFKLSEASKVGYISVPNISPQIQSAANKIKSRDNQFDVRIVGSTDRVTAFQFVCGVPMFGYRGVSEYWKNYNLGKKNNLGSHIYEGTDYDKRNSAKLVNISPQSTLNGKEKMAEEESQTQKSNSEQYDVAFEGNLIDTSDELNCYLILLDETKINEIVKKIETAIVSNNIVVMDALYNDSIKETEEFVNVFKVNQISIKNDGAKNHEADVLKDHATSSLIIMKNIKQQNTIEKQYFDALLKLKEALERSNPQVYKDFIDAMCCGAIYKESRFSYKFKNGDGMFAAEIELTSRKMDTYGENVPLYNAFVNYKKLGDEAKNSIKQKVDAIMDDDSKYEEIYLAKKPEIKELIVTQGKEDSENARKLFPSEAQSIVNELEQLYKILA